MKGLATEPVARHDAHERAALDVPAHERVGEERDPRAGEHEQPHRPEVVGERRPATSTRSTPRGPCRRQEVPVRPKSTASWSASAASFFGVPCSSRYDGAA